MVETALSIVPPSVKQNLKAAAPQAVSCESHGWIVPEHVNVFPGWLVFLTGVLNEFAPFGLFGREARQTGFENRKMTDAQTKTLTMAVAGVSSQHFYYGLAVWVDHSHR